MAAHFDIRIFTNKMIITNPQSGQSIARMAARPFSSSRLLIGDLDAAEQLLGSILKEMDGWRRFFRASITATIQPMEQSDGGLSAVETQILCDLGVRLGFTQVDIV